MPNKPVYRGNISQVRSSHHRVFLVCIWRKLKGTRFSLDFLKNVLDVERMGVPRKYFIAEILSPWGTSGINLKEIEGYALFPRFSQKCTRYWTHACTAKIFHWWDPLTIGYLWYQFEGNRRVRECVSESVFEKKLTLNAERMRVLPKYFSRETISP